MCKDCRKQIIGNPDIRKISEEKKALIDRLLLERISLAGICRVAGVSEGWLRSYANEKYESVRQKAEPVAKKKKTRLTIQCDGMHSFVGRKENKYRIWFAIGTCTKEIVGVHVGSRDKGGAKGPGDSLPPEYR